MVYFLFFCLASVGLTAILVDGTIFLPLRRRVAEETDRVRRRRERKGLSSSFSLYETVHEILGCYQCCGFWAGLFCSPYLLTTPPFWNGLPASPRLILNSLFAVLLCGFVGSLLATVYLKSFLYVHLHTLLAETSLPQPPKPEDIPAEPENVVENSVETEQG